MTNSVIFFIERNVHGAWVIYGINGIKQYYGYTKKEAIAKYNGDCKIIVNGGKI